LADALASGASGRRARAGSNPARGTISFSPFLLAFSRIRLDNPFVKRLAWLSFSRRTPTSLPFPLPCPPEHLQAFLWWLSRKDRPITVPTKFPALHAFFRWLAKENLRADNPITKVTPPKLNEPLPKTVNEDHLAKTLNAIPLFRFAGLRDATLFCLALDSGARLSELLSLRLCNLELLSHCAKVKGKGNKERMMDFGTLTSQLLSRYLTACLTRFRALSPDNFLFLTDDGRPISKRQGQDRWKKWQRRAG
jgi:site-specific recombinase XerD